MLKVTDAARGRLLTKLEDRNAAEGEAFRFTRKKGGWKLRIDHAQPNDTTLTHQGRSVLFMDQEVSRSLTKMTLDVTQHESKSRLTLGHGGTRRSA